MLEEKLDFAERVTFSVKSIDAERLIRLLFRRFVHRVASTSTGQPN